MTEPEAFSIRIPSGTLRAHRFGAASDRLVVCVHGLSANSRSFDFLAPRLAASGRTVVTIDLRGRGFSDTTGPGTYGWVHHAKDVLDVVASLGATRFDYVGHSMGAFIGMAVARVSEGTLNKLALIDAVGRPEPASIDAILEGVKRLGTVYESRDSYVAGVRKLGTIEPWDACWEAHYRYDLVDSGGGVTSRTSRDAVVEDLTYGGSQTPATLWASVNVPTLLVRAARPLGGGFVVQAADRDAFLAAVPRASAVEVDANHYAVITHAVTAKHVDTFLG